MSKWTRASEVATFYELDTGTKPGKDWEELMGTNWSWGVLLDVRLLFGGLRDTIGNGST